MAASRTSTAWCIWSPCAFEALHRCRSARVRISGRTASASETMEPFSPPSLSCIGLRVATEGDVANDRRASEQRRQLAITEYLGRYKGQARVHTASDLRVFLSWRDDRHMDPLDVTRVGRAQVEAFVRWVQET